MKHDPGGQPAVTTWKVRGRMRTGEAGVARNRTWLALEPLTGRTHQLRVHCAAMGWPIVGDTIYGTAPRSGGPPLHLHARHIVVPLYKNRAPIEVGSSCAADRLSATFFKCSFFFSSRSCRICDPTAFARASVERRVLTKTRA